MGDPKTKERRAGMERRDFLALGLAFTAATLPRSAFAAPDRGAHPSSAPHPPAAALVLSLLGGVLDGRPEAEAASGAWDTGVSATRGGHLGARSLLGDVLRHPSFAGFSRLLLPWDDRAYDEQIPLTRVGSLLPFHSHVDPETVASVLNRMIDEAALGRSVF